MYGVATRGRRGEGASIGCPVSFWGRRLDIEVRGLSELKATFDGLPATIQSKLLKGATATAAAVFRVEAVLRAPYYTGPVQAGHPPAGTLKKAIYQTRLTSECTLTREVWKVGIRQGRNATVGAKGAKVSVDAFYGRFVEFGTVKMAARPFMRPAFDTKKQAASQAFGTYLAFGLPQAVEHAKRGG